MKGTLKLLIAITALSFSVLSCNKEAPKTIPVLETAFPTNITSTSVTLGGNITGDGGAAVTSRGVCWSVNQFPSTTDSKTTEGTGTGSFSSSVTGLTAGTTYYVRAYAVNAVGVAYGNQVTFTTERVLPTITTATVISITSTSAVSGGDITSDGGAPITARGVCWSTGTNPTLVNNSTTNGTGTGTFTSNLTNLNPGSTYYVRAYATNSIGTVYGNQVSFTAPAAAPTLTTTAISAITATTASSGGDITNDGGGSITARGVCWSTSQNPSTTDSKTSDTQFEILSSSNPFSETSSNAPVGTFISSITGLTPGTTYYVRAYATNSAGTSYGNQLSFTTGATTPTVTTTAASSVNSSSAQSGGNVTNDGGATVSARGVCWSATQNPTIANSKTTNGTGTGIFISSITGLNPGTTYYIRAYATNSAGTAYGEQATFTTSAIAPTVTTTAVSSLTTSSAVTGGNVTADGGASVSERGICWGTSANPTTGDNKVTSGTGTGEYEITISGLTPGRTYYIRAYAINTAGTSYGNQVICTTISEMPTVITSIISAVDKTTATTGGTITSDGGGTISARGVCWSTGQNPTISNSKTQDGTGTGTYTSNITGLNPGTTYYVRAYATNSAGTAYGAQGILSTLPDAPVVTTTAVTEITTTTATGGGNVTADGGRSVTARGICWSTGTMPTISNSKTTDATGTGSFTSSIINLTPGATYYVRAYATNSEGTSYGNQVSFSADINLPTVTTADISNITSTTADGGGDVTATGGGTITAKGICWSTSENPTIADSKTSDGTGSGTFASALNALTPSTVYYVRAYATNAKGTSYGAQVTFTSAAPAGE